MLTDIKEGYGFYLLLRKHWEKPSTIVFLLCALLGSGLWLLSGTDLESFSDRISPLEIGLLCVVVIAVWGSWYYGRKPHVTQTGKIGIAIAIDCETKKERARLKSEFVAALRDQIRSGNQQHYDVFELSDYHSGQICDQESARKYQRIIKAHLLMYGQCRIRTHEGKPTYVLDLHAGVSHRPVPPEVGALLKHDMGQVFPSKALIPEADEVMGFQVTQDIVQHAARYTLGTASLLSHDAITAFDLHRGLWEETKLLSESDADVFPGYKLLKNKLPGLLVTEGLLSARFYFITRTSGYLDAIRGYLDVVQDIDPNNYDAHLVRAIYYFSHDHDITRAKEEIRKAKNDRNAAWQYSDAFLKAYEGDLERAHKTYKRAFLGDVTPETPLDVELFIHEVLESEPEKIQLWYCLGMVNYFYKRDLYSARRDFSKFVELAERNNSFPTSVQFAKKYLAEIEEKITHSQ